jgi:hypothetical protein
VNGLIFGLFSLSFLLSVCLSSDDDGDADGVMLMPDGLEVSIFALLRGENKNLGSF